ncbi:MAG: M61 family metallopeptidase [Ignavibacteriales bacterium]|nr:M61 family metallopeptidase [Ignavibacteriales bacterium]
MRCVILPVIFLSFTAMAFAQPVISYTLSMSQPWTHYFEVQVNFDGLPANQAAFELSLPAWRTGRYLILDFAGSVQEFSASDKDGRSLRWEKNDKDTWRIEKGTSTRVSARYKVYANEFHLRTKGLNDEGAFLDGAAAFMYASEYRQIPVTLTVVPYGTWHVTTGLERMPGKANTFVSPSYDYLVDCPLFIGNQKDFEFEAEGKKHVLSILGEGKYDAPVVIEDLKKIIKVNKDFWGDLPYDRYVFMLHFSSQGGGGTEHINSTILGARPFALAQSGSYRGFLGLVSHEFFHTWNVKQIRPAGISPYDWSKENYTKELWVSEGTTSYYGRMLLLRAGYILPTEIIDQLPREIENERMRPGNRVQPVTESSFDAWIKYWKGNENSFNAESDYYDRGADVSLILDLEIRHRSGNRYSLDDVMRALYKRFPWNGSGYTVEDLRKLCEEFGGESFAQFFDDHVHGTKSLAWEKALSYAGLAVMTEPKGTPWLGTFTRDQDGRAVIRTIVAGSPAYVAGLNTNDEIIALDGYRVRSSDLTDRVTARAVGETVRITVMRDDRLREFQVTLTVHPVPSYRVKRVEKPLALQKQIFESWLGTKW